MTTIIYNRTSTVDQNPENQLKDCLAVIKRLNITDYEVLEEKKSAFKDDVVREVFNSIVERIKKRLVENLIVWDLDRLFRNRKKLIAFFEVCKMYNCKIYSFRQQFLEDINIAPAPWNEMLFNQLIFILGWIAEEESVKKSARVKSAVRKDTGITLSRKGNKWGRKSLQNEKLRQEVLKLKQQGLSIRDISKQVYYFDKNNNKKFLSPSSVFKLLANSYT
jgi:DNA invertase Pin-like site-specific DNA recombinase